MLELAEPIAERPTRGRPRVSIVTETFPPEINGVALTLARLVKGLRSRGHDVSLVRPRQSAADGVRDGDAGDLTLVHGVPLPSYEGLLMGLNRARTYRPARACFREAVAHVQRGGKVMFDAAGAI